MPSPLSPSSGVSVGLATKTGLAGAIASAVAAIVISIEHNQALFTGSGKEAAFGFFASLISIVLGRSYQAAHIEKPATAIAEIPDALAALAAEAQANVAVVQASPDGVDGPHVPFSGALPQGAPPPTAP